jgi:hypothetical protein
VMHNRKLARTSVSFASNITQELQQQLQKHQGVYSTVDHSDVKAFVLSKRAADGSIIQGSVQSQPAQQTQRTTVADAKCFGANAVEFIASKQSGQRV